MPSRSTSTKRRPQPQPDRPFKSAAPLHTDAERSALFSRVRQRGTEPELVVRQIASDEGLSFRTRNRDLPGSPDLANRRRKWAIFVHGCYWHSHQGCRRATIPKRNRAFWTQKFAGNRERDRRALSELRRLGFRVAVVWECELTTRPADVRQRLRRLSRTTVARSLPR